MTVTPLGNRSTAPRRDDGFSRRDALDDVIEIDAHFDRHGGGADHVHQVAAAKQRHLEVTASSRV